MLQNENINLPTRTRFRPTARRSVQPYLQLFQLRLSRKKREKVEYERERLIGKD